MTPPSRHVHIVDDDGAVRRSTAVLLRLNGFTTDQWASGLAFVEALDGMQPGCILLDLRMPEMDGMAVLDRLARAGVGMPAVMMTGHGDMAAAIRAMKAGAVDFLEKPAEKAVLLAALSDALDKLAGARDRSSAAQRARSAVAMLTAREREVLTGLADGLSNKSIAQRLGISPRTVEIHRANVMARLEVQSLSHALRIAFVAGLGGMEPTD